MTARPRKAGGGINLSTAFATASASIMKTAESSMPAYAQHVADTREIAPNPLNARSIDPSSPGIKQLAESLRTDGQLQAIPVVPRADFLSWEGFSRYAKQIGDVRYVVIGGGRRRAAAEVAGLSRMEISIKSGLTREAFLRMTVIENIEREDLTPLEEARQIQLLRDATGESYAELGRQLNGRTKGWVAQRLDLLKLSERLQAELAREAEGSMSTTQARRLVKLIRDKARAEAGDGDDVWLPEDRQWELWEALRDSERLPGKRSDSPEPSAAPSNPAIPATRANEPANARTAPAPRPRVDQGSLSVRVDQPAHDLVSALRGKMTPESWAEFVAEAAATMA